LSGGTARHGNVGRMSGRGETAQGPELAAAAQRLAALADRLRQVREQLDAAAAGAGEPGATAEAPVTGEAGQGDAR
jgi:outer membrane murein-binding lipoprotein Lpp